MIALERAGVKVNNYFASEIDQNAIKVSKQNYPNIIHLGNVKDISYKDNKLSTSENSYSVNSIDLLIGGFPCQDLSINKANRKGLKGERSGLFYEYVRLLHEINPKYFLVENNYKMPKKDEEIITEVLGVRPILINSSVVSAQQRKRLYWTNIPFTKIESNKNYVIADIIEHVKHENLINETTFNEKICIEKQSSIPVRIGTIGRGGQGERVYSIYGKSVTLTANGGGRGAKTGLYLIDGEVRKLTPLEAERLQNLPDNYTEGLSDTNRLKVIGNGWTVDIIVNIFKGMKL